MILAEPIIDGSMVQAEFLVRNVESVDTIGGEGRQELLLTDVVGLYAPKRGLMLLFANVPDWQFREDVRQLLSSNLSATDASSFYHNAAGDNKAKKGMTHTHTILS